MYLIFINEVRFIRMLEIWQKQIIIKKLHVYTNNDIDFAINCSLICHRITTKLFMNLFCVTVLSECME